MYIAGMLEWRGNESDKFCIEGHVTRVQTDLGRSTRPEVWLRPKLWHEVDVEAKQEAANRDRSESLAGRLRDLSEGRQEAEADGTDEDAGKVAQERGVGNHDLQGTPFQLQGLFCLRSITLSG